jgi:hypothetical protein
MLILQQSGNQVTGQLKVNSADFGTITDGIIVGNTLRFNVWRAYMPGVNNRPDVVGAGELVMDPGGRSFTGNVFGAATSGTFLGR